MQEVYVRRTQQPHRLPSSSFLFPPSVCLFIVICLGVKYKHGRLGGFDGYRCERTPQTTAQRFQTRMLEHTTDKQHADVVHHTIDAPHYIVQQHVNQGLRLGLGLGLGTVRVRVRVRG